MNPRQRLLTTISGGIPDRVPISTYELCGYNQRSFENNDQSYTNLMNLIREKTDCVCMWNPTSNETFFNTASSVKCIKEEYRESDALVIRKSLETPKGIITQKLKLLDNINTVWQTEHFCKTIDDVNKALSIPYTPVSYDTFDYERIKREVDENGIIMASLSDALCSTIELMEFGAATIWAVTETDHFAETIDIMHERIMENLNRMLDANVVDLYRICGPEYATPPYLSPAFFNRFVRPYITEMTNLIHSKGAKVRIHSHGKIAKVLDMIISTGADAIDPCEAPPDGDITLKELKKQIDGRMSIFGNIQLKLLEQGSCQEIRKEVIKCMDDAKENGGYIIMPTAAPINIPLSEKTEENYVTYIETALEYGEY